MIILMKPRDILFLACLVLLSASDALAQLSTIDAEQVRSWMDGKRKVALIDTRMPEEYQQAHIPGAINVMPEQMQSAKGKLPKEKTTPMIFYCRGMS
jgi:rhodanese-related sulfurtransferase